MIDFKKLFTKILGCCYTVGTDSTWEYRKYADGTLEMWSYDYYTSSPYLTNPVNGWWAHRTTKYFPNDVHPKDSNYIVLQEWEIGTGYTIIGPTFNKSSSAFTTYVLAGSSGSQTCSVRIYVRGKWK
jgi:hypothetical protein